MSGKLIETVIHDGIIYAAGTTRDEAPDVPDVWFDDAKTPAAAPTPAGIPDESWKNDAIKAYADEHGIDLGGATTKSDMLAVINPE